LAGEESKGREPPSHKKNRPFKWRNASIIININISIITLIHNILLLLSWVGEEGMGWRRKTNKNKNQFFIFTQLQFHSFPSHSFPLDQKELLVRSQNCHKIRTGLPHSCATP
jgi:hypothetical protein